MVSLNYLLRAVNLPQIAQDITIDDISLDSRQVRKNSLFAALPGSKDNGSIFIPMAIERGAVAILLQHNTDFPSNTHCIPIFCNNPRYYLSLITAAFFTKYPAHQIAITGTNGKTSTADFIRQLWILQNLKAASIGTLGVIHNSHFNYQGATLTTPDNITLHHILSGLAENQVDHVVMEASSHGLVQYRLDGFPIEAAGFTNLTRDHLDYHHDFEHYLDAKLRLFRHILPGHGIAAVNADIDPQILNKIKQITTEKKQQLRLVGEAGQFLKLSQITPLPKGQEFTITTEQSEPIQVTIPLVGRYQLDNIVLALALTAKNHQHLLELITLLPQLKGVRGRMEQAAILPNGAAIYVDYAHTPDAIAHVLQSLRPHTHRQLYIIFGAGGDRDAGKRPLMAQEAEKYADHLIITDDNPRNEDPATIRQEVKDGAPNAIEVAGREQAIADTIHRLKTGDILVVAGKGHEQGQIIGDTIHPFDDVQIIQKYAGIL